MIFKREKERLKDILIDHVYDYCNNEIVHKLEGDNIKLEYDNPKLLNDPVTKSLVEQIKKSKKIKGYYKNRETKFCNLITEDNLIQSTLSEKLNFCGFKKSKNLEKNIIMAKKYLIARSYLSENNPIRAEVKLTEKGLLHYHDGKSFEDNFINHLHSNVGIIISIISVIIATIAIILAS